MGEVIDESFRFRQEQRLNELKIEHRDLDSALQRLTEDPLMQEALVVKRMKKRKLLLKDQIAWLERQLDPDIRA